MKSDESDDGNGSRPGSTPTTRHDEVRLHPAVQWIIDEAA